MNEYEDTLFVFPIALHITVRGGIITRPLLESDGPCVEETRYMVHDENRPSCHWIWMYHRAIADECRFAGLASLPRFKDDGYFRFYDDAEQVVEAWRSLIRWMKGPAKELPKKHYKPILSRWNHMITRKVSNDHWEKTKALSSGMPVKKRSDLGILARDLADRRDLEERN